MWRVPRRLAADPLFEHELALELGMTVGEMHQRMSLEELTVRWPLYWAYRNRQRKRAEQQAANERLRI